ncbi:MAG: thiamine pyrophosphate-dependent dehydrogenase E1 component subunit alpha [Pseudomonadota bacterium]
MSELRDNARLLHLYKRVLWIRMVEEAIADRYGGPGQVQEMRCPVHLSIGQEASAVGVCEALEVTDKAFSTHRCHAHYLAKGGGIKPMLAEIFGKASGCIGGRGGSMHLAAPEVGMVASVPIVSSSIPLAVGSALADAIDGKDAVSVAFIGDAAIEEGIFHESANFAQLRKLNVIFVCENNLYSVYTPLHERQPDRPLTDVARAHGMLAEHVDGNDVEAVLDCTQRLVRRARQGEGPSFLLLDTYRWREHCGPNFDNDIGYRTEEEFLEWKALDPVEKIRTQLKSEGALDEGDEAALVAELNEAIDEGFEYARNEPLPVPEAARTFVYA